MSNPSRSRWVSWLVAGAVAGCVTLAPSRAHADPVDPTGKGIAGGALLGGEVVLITTAIIGVKAWWPYLVFGAVGAGGGAVGGYFVEQVDDGKTPEPALYMLAGGLALVIPTVVAVLNATAYEPEEDEEGFEEETPEGDQPAEPPDVEEGIQEEGRARHIPLSLIGLDADGKTPRLSLGVPAVDVRPLYTPQEITVYGLEQETEVQVPLVSGVF